MPKNEGHYEVKIYHHNDLYYRGIFEPEGGIMLTDQLPITFDIRYIPPKDDDAKE